MITRPSFISELDWKYLVNKYKNEADLEKIVEKVKNDYPIQYAIGDVEFLNTKILVDENVLIPRFETELLVSKILNYIKKYDLENTKILDLCTGSGCIAISLKKNLPNSSLFAVDISENALDVARKNADLNNTKVQFIKKDILKNMNFKDKFSIIISNPPYVKNNEFVTPNTKYEPNIALYPGEDDIIFYKNILNNAKNVLEENSIIAFEIGSDQAERITEYAYELFPKSTISIEKDYNGLDRFIFVFINCI